MSGDLDLLSLDASGQLALLASGRVTAVELLKLTLARHEQTHRRLNAVVAADLERALERAKAIDDIRARGGALGPLAGLPMTIKDTLDVSGMPASSGLEAFRRRQAEDAAVVAQARRAGAVIWGKTNVPVMAGDWQSFNGLYGTSNNPWDVSRTPGGSSGGAAAALAAGVTALEIGSDIGGSLRVPAHFCGVFSHKPTWALTPQHGHVPPKPGSWQEPDLNVIGPMARSARDLRLLLSVIADGGVSPKAPPADLTKARIGLWLEAPGLPLDPQVRAVLEAYSVELAAAGAQVEVISPPVDVETLLEAYLLLLGSIVGADMPESQIRRMELMRPAARFARSRGAGPFSWAGTVMAYTARHRDWLAADAIRARLRREMEAVFEGYDAILAPIAPSTAFPHSQGSFASRRLKFSDGGGAPYITMLGWIALATACLLPATTLPAGIAADGLPVGAQLIGGHGTDARLLSLAQAIDENVRGFTPPPAG
ncbi:amidase family protein [Phenylobacterium sp.]|uniref:amidase family protein n=1 Tax=Phenylobacterium sp. TaxID=1871053 RepID=UPI000C8C018C|nr:amidase family protein [Phenylobacterium sp.]MAK83432.1 amidase [Phenylobacterium sp.]